MKKLFSIKSIVCFFVLLVAVSCQKDENIVPLEEQLHEIKLSVPEDINVARVRFAKALAKAIKNPEFANFLIIEAKKEFMGDRDILYAKIKSEILPGTDKKVFAILAETEKDQVNDRGETEVTSLTFYSSAVTQLDPGLNIYLYIPESMENNSSISVTKVAVMDENFDEQTATIIPVYDSNENYIAFPATIAYPDEPFFVVKENEKILPVFDSTGKTKYGNDAPVDSKPYVYNVDEISFYDFGVVWTGAKIEPPSDGAIDNDGDGYYQNFGIFSDPNDADPCDPDPYSSACPIGVGNGPESLGYTAEGWCDDADRDSRSNREELFKVKFANNSAWHFAMGGPAWLDGKPELQITCITVRNPGTPGVDQLTKNIRDKRKYFREDGEPEWYNYRERNGDVPLLFFNWDLENITDPTLYQWMEIDKTDLSFDLTLPTVSFKFKARQNTSTPLDLVFTPIAIKIKWNPANENLGQDLVYYCDPANGEGTMYNTGYIHFNIKEEE